jgi:hypothetical protein
VGVVFDAGSAADRREPRAIDLAAIDNPHNEIVASIPSRQVPLRAR